jgi:hypothetical protein
MPNIEVVIRRDNTMTDAEFGAKAWDAINAEKERILATLSKPLPEFSPYYAVTGKSGGLEFKVQLPYYWRAR